MLPRVEHHAETDYPFFKTEDNISKPKYQGALGRHAYSLAFGGSKISKHLLYNEGRIPEILKQKSHLNEELEQQTPPTSIVSL